MTVLSASSVSAYEDCHLMWYFEYVERRPQPPFEPRDTGIVVHDFAEAILKHGAPIADGGPCDVCRMVPHSPQCPNTSDADPLVEVFIEDIHPTYGEPVLVEAAFELDVEGVTYTGFIDAVDVHAGAALLFSGPEVGSRTTVRDLKTTKNRPRKGKFRNALIGYGEGAKALGYEADEFLLDYIVRTRKPYYWPESQEVPDEDEIDLWASNVVGVHRSIESGDFEPTGVGTYVCSYCPFNDICGPYDRWLELTSPLRKE